MENSTVPNGKTLLLNALRGEITPRPAWLPFVGCHGGNLIGASATDYLCSADKLVEGLLEARRRYRPDGLPVVFDLQVEAEVLGCELQWAKDVPPAVRSHPLAEGATLEDLPEVDLTSGRFPQIFEAFDRLKVEIGEDTGLLGLVCGPFTLALHLLGNDIFLEMYDDEEGVKRLLDYCSRTAATVADAYLDHGADVIAVVDPMTSQISADHFDEFVAEPMNRIFDRVRERGALSSIFVCGDVTRNLPSMVVTRADNICVDEQIDMAHLKDLALDHGKSFGGNIALTAVLLLGTEDDARREAVRIMDQCGSRGYVLAPGCDLPYAVPPANLEAVASVVHDSYLREVTRAQLEAATGDAAAAIEPPDYSVEPKLVIDVITLDSSACAPCQYMVDAAQRAAAKADGPCDVREHKIKNREGIAMMQRLGVKNLPTICVDGRAVFISIIPDQTTLVESFNEALKRRG